MTKLQMLDYLTGMAKRFRSDTGAIMRNSHMHAATEEPPPALVDAVLVGFVNAIGINQGVDYGLYARDLE